MFDRMKTVLAAAFGVALLGTVPAWSNVIETATITASCTNYTFEATGTHLRVGDKYAVKWNFDLATPNGTNARFRGRIMVNAYDQNGDFDNKKTYNWNPALIPGSYAFTRGKATLYDLTKNAKRNSVQITFTPAQFSCPGKCECNSSNQSNFNGTGIPVGDYIWFNSAFKASGIPTNGTTLYFTNSTITFSDSNGTPYTVPVPNGQVTFSTSATCTTTNYDPVTNTWFTTVPIKGDDEILMQDVSWLVPTGFSGQVTGNVTWNTTMSTNDSGITVQWQWGAAVYSEFTTDYNQLAVKPAHQSACSYNNGDHAGTPEGTDSNGNPWKNFVVGGGRGGGGSNFTGSWSGTVNAMINCPMD